jgi:FkbM family methyltransferase
MMVFANVRKASMYLRLLMFSRQYFRNWFWAYLRYYLFKKGLIESGALVAVCRDGAKLAIHPKIHGFLVRRLFDGTFTGLRCGDGVVIAKGFSVPVQELLFSSCVDDAIRLGWVYDAGCGCWVRDGVRFKHIKCYTLEAFNYGEHRYIDVRSRVVVDVGAGFGETAVYFILNGAKHVVAVEPCPEGFRELLENLKLNNVVGRVTPINAALASKHSKIGIECPSGKIFVDTITLGDIAKVVDVSGAVLKMDCEGCEYDVILNDYEHVRLFDEVYFEYHAYATKTPIDVLLKKMSKDYKCEIVSDEEFCERHGFSRKLLGLVKCVKV